MDAAIEDRFKSVLSEHLGVTKSEFSLNSHLANDLHCDSLDMVEIMMAVEEEFNLELDDDEFLEGEIETVGDYLQHIEKYLRVTS